MRQLIENVFFLDYLQDVTPTSIIVRLLLAMVLGGTLGAERGIKRRPAGFRTYVVVCLGATMAMMTNQYVAQVYQTGDPVRLAAQVISGIGFLGAGTIMVTGRNQIRGLTTAAGLWAAACLGLAIGIGFYMGAILCAVCLYVSMRFFNKLDLYILKNSPYLRIYAEFKESKNLSKFLTFVRSKGWSPSDLELNKIKGMKDAAVSASMDLHIADKESHLHVMEQLAALEGVSYIEELN